MNCLSIKLLCLILVLCQWDSQLEVEALPSTSSESSKEIDSNGLLSQALANSDAADDSVLVDSKALDISIDCNGQTSPMFCADCFQRGFCNGGDHPELFPCPQSAPYCDDGKCSKEIGPDSDICEEQQLEQAALCTSEGFFPDPGNCEQYLFCYDPKRRPPLPRLTYKCPPQHVFDSVLVRCKKKVAAKDCVTMKCTKANTFVTYSANARFYGFCRGLDDVVMFQCPEMHVFNAATYGCDFKCPAVGYYANAARCNQFYICYKAGVKIETQLNTCPARYRYNSESRKCELDADGECVV